MYVNTSQVVKPFEDTQTKICLMKIWSQSLVSDDTWNINFKFLYKLKDDIEKFEALTWEKVTILSSWAVSLGRMKVNEQWKNSDNFSKSQLASIWQAPLISLYKKIFEERIIAQILLNDELHHERFISRLPEKDNDIWKWICPDIVDEVKQNSEQHLVKVLRDNVRCWVLNILNYNDSMSSAEVDHLSDKTDNDANVTFLTEIMNRSIGDIYPGIHISRVVFLTNTRGILDADKKTVLWEKIPLTWLSDTAKQDLFNTILQRYTQYITTDKSKSGTGGMQSKLENALRSLFTYKVSAAHIAFCEDGLGCILRKEKATSFVSS